MTTKCTIQLVILDPRLEERVINQLGDDGFDVSGRCLALDVVPPLGKSESVLLSTWDVVTSGTSRHEDVEGSIGLLLEEYRAVIVIGEQHHPRISTVSRHRLNTIADVIESITSRESEVEKLEYQLEIVGIAPRVGVRVLRRAIERATSEALALLRGRKGAERPILYCSELDDQSLSQLFSRVLADRGKYKEQGVVISKIPGSRRALGKVRRVARELSALGVTVVCSLPFDQELYLTEELSKSGTKALQPIFDWIAKAK